MKGRGTRDAHEPGQEESGPVGLEALVEVGQTLEQELEPVVAAQLCPGRLAVKDEEGQQRGGGAAGHVVLADAFDGGVEGGIVVESETVAEPQDGQLLFGGWGRHRPRELIDFLQEIKIKSWRESITKCQRTLPD